MDLNNVMKSTYKRQVFTTTPAVGGMKQNP